MGNKQTVFSEEQLEDYTVRILREDTSYSCAVSAQSGRRRSMVCHHKSKPLITSRV